MKRLVFALVLIVCTQTIYADVNISCAYVSSTEIEVSYAMDGGDANLPRLFALDIAVDNGATIDDITYTDPCFWVHLGTIEITDGSVTNEGSPVAPSGDPCALGGLGTGGITIEMGSLYSSGDANHTTAPSSSGTLLNFTVSSDCNVMISENAIRGGVTLENTTQASTNLPTNCYLLTDCLFNDGSQEYLDWVAWGKPDCWCYQRQCRGDATGTALGPYWVQAADLAILKAAWYKTDVDLASVPNGICADFNHAALGPYRVQAADLAILKTYWYKADALVPVCDQAPVITGPYNFWITPP